MFVDVLVRVIPLFLVILIGYIASRWHKFSAAEAAFSAFVFHIALPALLFQLAARSDLSTGVPAAVPIVIALAAGIFAALVFGGLRLSSKGSARETMTTTMSASYGNVSYLGVPLVLGVLGTAGGLAASMGQLFHNIIFMVIYPMLHGMIARERGPEVSFWNQMRAVIYQALLKNPVVWAVTLGLVVSSANLTMPQPLTALTDVLAGAAAPGALFAIGLSMRRAVRVLREGNLRLGPIGVAALAKLALLPALTALLLVWISPDLPLVWKATVVLMAGMPTSATAFVLAQANNGDARPTAAIIVVTNAAAVLTLPLVAQVFISGS